MKYLFSIILILFLNNCGATTGFYSPAGSGSLFMSYTDSVSASGAVTGQKSGEACAMNIFGWIVVGDSSIRQARSNAGIAKIATVDKKYLNVLLLFGQVCTIVTGE
jgi:hypothetical protein